MRFSKSIQNLIDNFSKLPGIGPKTATRLVFYIMSRPKDDIKKFQQALLDVHNEIMKCATCQNYSESNPCELCKDTKRNRSLICVIAKPQDIQIIEKTKEFAGLYHVLGGTLNPIEGITPEKLTVKQLLERIQADSVTEVILALNPDIEGETTTLYLKKVLEPHSVTVSRLARGLPMGADLEYADEVTLINALKGRREV